jgi:hypothetical protein
MNKHDNTTIHSKHFILSLLLDRVTRGSRVKKQASGGAMFRQILSPRIQNIPVRHTVQLRVNLIISEHLKNQALQVVRFGNGEQDRMIAALRPPLQNAELFAGIERCFG